MKYVKTKKRFLLSIMLIALMAISSVNVFADSYNWGGLRIARDSSVAVYSDENCTQKIGTIYKYEGYTVLNTTSKGFEIQYSTSKGSKHGYTNEWFAEFPCGLTGLAKVRNTTNVYYGTSTTVNPVAGTVYTDEFVSFLAKNGDWAYIEYDTSSGRKRGYTYYNNLVMINRWENMPDIYMHQNPGVTVHVSGNYTIYSGPSSQYASVGSIGNENITAIAKVYIAEGKESIYIEYNVPGNAPRKSGFIVFDKYPELASQLSNVISENWTWEF